MFRIPRNSLRATLALAAVLAASLPLPARGPMSQVAVEKAPSPTLRPVNSKQILEEVHRPGANAVLVNVWATWCVPCREEFPDLVRVSKEFEKRGLRVVLVSADFDDDRETTVRKFLVAQGVDFPAFLKEEKDEVFIDGLDPRWSGALPVSLLYDGSGKARNFWEGTATYAEMKQRVLEVLDHPAPNPKTEEVKQPKEAR